MFGADQADSQFKLTTFEGSHEANDSFKAEMLVLEQEQRKQVSGTGGKSSVNWSPYINLQWTNEDAAWGKEGVFISNGWSGQWTTISTNTGNGVEVIAKQEYLDTYLAPGESIRSPLITLLFWEMDLMRSQNIWRDWVYNVAMPQPGGEPIPTMLHGNTAAGYRSYGNGYHGKIRWRAIRKWMELGFDIDAWQMDAGWYDMAYGARRPGWTPGPDAFAGAFWRQPEDD